MTQRLDYTAIAPAGVKALGSVYGYIMQSGLPRRLVNLVYLRASQINGCAYCIDMHSSDLIKDGLAVEKLALVQAWREAGSLFDARERAALAWTETVTRVADTAVPDSDFQAASAVFSAKELADLTIAIGLMNAYNRLQFGQARPAHCVTKLISLSPFDELIRSSCTAHICLRSDGKELCHAHHRHDLPRPRFRHAARDDRAPLFNPASEKQIGAAISTIVEMTMADFQGHLSLLPD